MQQKSKVQMKVQQKKIQIQNIPNGRAETQEETQGTSRKSHQINWQGVQGKQRLYTQIHWWGVEEQVRGERREEDRWVNEGEAQRRKHSRPLWPQSCCRLDRPLWALTSCHLQRLHWALSSYYLRRPLWTWSSCHLHGPLCALTFCQIQIPVLEGFEQELDQRIISFYFLVFFSWLMVLMGRVEMQGTLRTPNELTRSAGKTKSIYTDALMRGRGIGEEREEGRGLVR